MDANSYLVVDPMGIRPINDAVADVGVVHGVQGRRRNDELMSGLLQLFVNFVDAIGAAAAAATFGGVQLALTARQEEDGPEAHEAKGQQDQQDQGLLAGTEKSSGVGWHFKSPSSKSKTEIQFTRFLFYVFVVWGGPGPLGNHGLTSTGSGRRCLLYTSPSPRDRQKSRMPSSA